MSIEELQFNPFTKLDKEWALVSAGTKDASNTMTVSWGGVGVLWNTNVVYIFLRDSRYTKKFVDENETFSLSFLGDQFHQALSLCGSKSGRDCDKWKEAGLTPVEKDGVIYPEEAELAFLCRKLAAVRLDDPHFIDKTIGTKFYADHDLHTMYIGEIMEVLKKD